MNMTLCTAVFVLLPKSFKEKLRIPRRGTRQPAPVAQPVFDENGNRKILKDIYRKVNELFTSEKLYLRDDLSLLVLSREVGANKTYVSQAIRLYSGMSYPQYLGSWRVSYSMQVMEQEHLCDDDEMAARCGYKATSTFILAFQTISGMTPKEWRKTKKILPL